MRQQLLAVEWPRDLVGPAHVPVALALYVVRVVLRELILRRISGQMSRQEKDRNSGVSSKRLVLHMLTSFTCGFVQDSACRTPNRGDQEAASNVLLVESDRN